MPKKPPVGVRQWIWRAFVQSALVPLILVEAVLIAVYLLSNNAIRDAQITHLRQAALADLQSSAHQQSRLIEEHLARVGALSEIYRNLTAQALLGPDTRGPAALALNADGVHYSPADDGTAASFYSSSTPAQQHDLAKVARLASVDPLMEEIVDSDPLVASVYFNSWDSYNRIYPWFDTPEQYPSDMRVADYNFYYLADAEHNPERKSVWTDVYLDPAGHGWMLSAIAPVYRGDFLEGVIGLDVTVDHILQQIGQLQTPWDGYAVLVSSDLNIMALPREGEGDFGLSELTRHSYQEAIRREMFKPEDFNLQHRPETRGLAAAIETQPQGVKAMELAGRQHLVAWTTIPYTGWHLLTVVDEQAVFHQTNALASHYQQIGMLLIAGLVGFYLIFFALMWLRARRLSEQLLAPIAGISGMLAEIGRGNWRPRRVDSSVIELDDMGGHVQAMGQQLHRSESLREATQQRLELVIDSATESLWEEDLVKGTLVLRGRFCQRFGVLDESLPRAAFLARVHPDDVPRLEASHRLAAGGGEPGPSEFRFSDDRGRYHWMLSRGRVVERDPVTGAPRLLAGTFVDIDALKATEQDLRHAMIQAQAASQAKSRFISSMSHELRTPLNAIYGFAQLMHLEHQGSEQDHDYLDEMLAASRHLNQLVGDVLDWASIQAEAPPLELQATPVRDLMIECADLVRLEVQAQGLTLELDLPDAGLAVQADPRRLRQVLFNLLTNAIKYNTPAGQITLGCRRAGEQLQLRVEDTGLGIDPALKSLVFEPFQRLGRENTTIQGTGIGLSLCQQFAALMNGRMGLRSTPGIGSCFWIELPLVRSAADGVPDEMQPARLGEAGVNGPAG